jgi:hypothetical protein
MARRTEQRLELIGFAQLMPSVVRFWPQQGEPHSLSRIPVLGPVPAWPSVGGSKYRRGMGAAEYGGVVGEADAQESHRRTEGYPRPDPCRYRESSGAEHHTAGAQNVHQASPQAYAHQVGRVRRDHLRWLAQRVEVDAREVRIMGPRSCPHARILRRQSAFMPATVQGLAAERVNHRRSPTCRSAPCCHLPL